MGTQPSAALGPTDEMTDVVPSLPVTTAGTPARECAAIDLGHFDVVETLGRGGCGVVVKAFDRKLRRHVAIKMMAPGLAATSAARKRFLREARAAAAVRHENVVQIYAVEEYPSPHLVMEYVPGSSLHLLLRERGPLEVAEVAGIGAQVARGLEAAHGRGLVHRDVKPANILVERSGGVIRVKLTDFGIARAADDASLTRSGMVVGTPLYMSPEQARGGAVDHRSDLFSLGSVLYEMASGRPSFRADSSLAVLRRVADEDPRPIREVVPETPAWLTAVVAKLQAKRPADRFQSAREVAEVLERCLARVHAGGAVRLPAGPSRRRTARRFAAAAVVAALLAAGVGLTAGGYLLPTAPPDPGPPKLAALPAASGVESAPPPTAEEIVAELRQRNPSFAGDAKMRMEGGRCVELRITDCRDLADITPVRRLRHLQAFSADNTRIADLSPLGGLPLRSIRLMNDSALRDLSPLRGMPLESLVVWGFQGGDLSPLSGMPLKFLNCGGGYQKLDLRPLRGLPLTSINLNCTQVDDLSPLAGMPLEELMLNPTRVTDLSPLAGMPLKRLFVNNSPVTDFSPIRGLPLEVIVLDFDAARDTEVLRAIPTLATINKRPANAFWAGVPEARRR